MTEFKHPWNNGFEKDEGAFRTAVRDSFISLDNFMRAEFDRMNVLIKQLCQSGIGLDSRVKAIEEKCIAETASQEKETRVEVANITGAWQFKAVIVGQVFTFAAAIAALIYSFVKGN